MTRQLIFIHGRSQERKDSVALKAEWIEAWKEGLAKSGLQMPIAESDVRFPFYGDTIYDLVGGKSSDEAADVVVRGPVSDDAEKIFIAAMLNEIRKEMAVTDAQVDSVYGSDVREKGPLNWEWTQAILRAIDRYVPYGSGLSVYAVTRDVYRYLKNPAIRQIIDTGIAQAMSSDREVVVVSHSLGTVVAYNVLSRHPAATAWKVPFFVTLGCPLAVTAVRDAMRALGKLQCPPCAKAWFNAMDERDVVALYPLTPASFPLTPPAPSITNKTDVRNNTANRHGIAGYLDDLEVAKRIYDGLMAK